MSNDSSQKQCALAIKKSDTKALNNIYQNFKDKQFFGSHRKEHKMF